jgi:hypothetical protein
MSTDKTARPKRKLDLSPQTVGVLSSAEGDPQGAVQSTNQTKQASCGGFQQDREPQKQQVPPAPAAPVKRP